jgi:hypothetical protein
MTRILIKKQQTQTQGKSHVEKEEKIGVMPP